MMHNDWTSLTIAGLALLCVSIPPAVYHVISQRAAADDFFKQKDAQEKMLFLLDQIKSDTRQEITQLFAGGNNLYTNISEIREIVEQMSLKQNGDQHILAAKLDFIQNQLIALSPQNVQTGSQAFLETLQQQTRHRLSTSQVEIEEIESLAASLQGSPAGSALYTIGSALLDTVAEQ